MVHVVTDKALIGSMALCHHSGQQIHRLHFIFPLSRPHRSSLHQTAREHDAIIAIAAC